MDKDISSRTMKVLTKERREMLERIADMPALDCPKTLREALASDAAREEMVRRLREYVKHSLICDAHVYRNGRCTCGAAAVLSETVE